MVPVFPAEIWPIVFSHMQKHRDLEHLWTECRHVSKEFKDEVERICASKHLPKTEVSFRLGKGFYGGMEYEENINITYISFVFDRVTRDTTTAIFKIHDCPGYFISDLADQLPQCIPSTDDPMIYRPKHDIAIRWDINDTELPELAFDHKAKEISFDWKKAYSLFFAEEKLFQYYLRLHVRSAVPYNEH